MKKKYVVKTNDGNVGHIVGVNCPGTSKERYSIFIDDGTDKGKVKNYHHTEVIK